MTGDQMFADAVRAAERIRYERRVAPLIDVALKELGLAYYLFWFEDACHQPRSETAVKIRADELDRARRRMLNVMYAKEPT